VQINFLIRPLGHGEQIFLDGRTDGRTELPFLGWDKMLGSIYKQD
jgi:hypothetical protein